MSLPAPHRFPRPKQREVGLKCCLAEKNFSASVIIWPVYYAGVTYIKPRVFSSWRQVIPVFPGFNMDLVQPSFTIQLLLNFLM